MSKEENMMARPTQPSPCPAPEASSQYFRFHLPHRHLGSVFVDNWFSLKAEAFARFFGTPVFLATQ